MESFSSFSLLNGYFNVYPSDDSMIEKMEPVNLFDMTSGARDLR